ncbi:MarR family winged helix-turn-helix transcriptional regulator [Meiothermus sp.]|uniref:MarR family winged helix-turn-helix transcriptional regulator n=1 Tax=Meiothermus sp. TaxID=1955249 RepID=UPI0021DBA17C|nr:MarR family transcriptional regulator [Meiothermus sp.]GIW33072.1 MAG: hypothetical protein KatS3mg072_0405 [Meiothermus sp.]
MTWTILTSIWKLSREVREETLPCLERLGLAPTDPWLLSEIEKYRYPTEVVRIMQMPAPTVSQMLKRLEANGLVTRSLDLGDLRRYHFQLTEQGKAVLEESRQCMLRAMERRLERLTTAQRHLFVELLDILAKSETAGKE